MNNTFPLQQKYRTSNVDASLISRQNKLNHLADFMREKNEDTKKKQFEIANQLRYSSSTSQRYRHDTKMLSPYRIQSNNNNKRTEKASNSNLNNDSHREPDVKRPQMTSNSLKTTQGDTKSNKKMKNILKAGSIQENNEHNDH